MTNENEELQDSSELQEDPDGVEESKPRRGRPPVIDHKKIRAARHRVEDLKYAKRDRDIYGDE